MAEKKRHATLGFFIIGADESLPQFFTINLALGQA